MTRLLIALLIWLLVAPVSSFAAVAFGSVVNVTPNTGANTGASPSITSQTTNPVMIVSIAIKHATATVSSLTITGFAGTAAEIKSQRSNNGASTCLTSIWSITAPTANTAGTVQANFSASVDYQMSVAAFSGADQSAPTPSGDAVSDGTITTPQTLTPANLTASDASSGASCNDQGQSLSAITPNGRYLSNSGNVNMASGDATGTTGVTLGTNSNQFYSKAVVRIAAASAGGSTATQSSGGFLSVILGGR